MCNHRGSIAELGREIVKTIFGGFSLVAYADEDPKSDSAPSADKGGEGEESSSGSAEPTINYEDLIAKARKEEKQKQYKTIEGLKGQVSTLTTQHNNDLLKIAELEGKLTEAQKKLSTAGTGDNEAITTLKGEVATLQGEKADLEKKVKDYESAKPVSREEIEKEIRAELEAEYTVKTYKAEQLAAHKDDLLVPELVMGSTKEEIDASLKAALERSADIRKKLGVKDKSSQSAPKVRPKTPNPSTSGVQTQGLDFNALATMDVRSPEYAALRKQLGLV